MAKGTNDRIKVFFACTFNKSKETVVNKFFRRFERIQDFNIAKWTARDPKDTLFDATKKEIKSCSAFIAVITEKSLWPAFEAVVRAANQNKRARKNTYIFLEKCIKNVDIYFQLTPNVFFFDEKSPGEAMPQVDFVIADLLKMTDDYRVTQAMKRVRVLQDGFGIVTYTHQLKVSQRDTARVMVLSGSFSITDDVIGRVGSGLSRVENLLDRSRRPLYDPSFSCRILSTSKEGGPVSIADIVDSGEDQESQRRKFSLILNRWLGPRETLGWSWGFTFPNMYKKRGKDSSTYRAERATPSLRYEVGFENTRTRNPTIKFKYQPYLIHYNKDNLEQGPPEGAMLQEMSLRFTKYVWKVQGIRAGDKIIVTWVRP